ncbi:MAG: hypothetical protein COV29_02310 [Candidatus Yanofskybacteria bacterium CG10_big_fil_rev_8_21_14_0_10_36_16]|uniref:Uncharacterized protein n=1 Tax=Candidatus Yanofskybacteria bacterium CG10_big_fil_rev_8_21_14_0_10_36_16 TaxID=1975096 RepID=A0A2J0Q7S9_9BACT|nr:MAG: hypothetical protein COV29_02310 [Candidatus Yanofskybacteria bacterium CG10_big_fil_rev_8_21_14_0_10_36_16]
MTISEPNQQFEKEIEQLEKELAAKKEAAKQRYERGEIEEPLYEKENLRDVIGEKLGKSSHETVQDDDNQQQSPEPPEASGDALSYLSNELRGEVQELVNIAFEESIDDAIKKANATENSALIDAFHDILVDELYKHLVDRGKLNEL